MREIFILALTGAESWGAAKSIVRTLPAIPVPGKGADIIEVLKGMLDIHDSIMDTGLSDIAIASELPVLYCVSDMTIRKYADLKSQYPKVICYAINVGKEDVSWRDIDGYLGSIPLKDFPFQAISLLIKAEEKRHVQQGGIGAEGGLL